MMTWDWVTGVSHLSIPPRFPPAPSVLPGACRLGLPKGLHLSDSLLLLITALRRVPDSLLFLASAWERVWFWSFLHLKARGPSCGARGKRLGPHQDVQAGHCPLLWKFSCFSWARPLQTSVRRAGGTPGSCNIVAIKGEMRERQRLQGYFSV